MKRKEERGKRKEEKRKRGKEEGGRRKDKITGKRKRKGKNLAPWHSNRHEYLSRETSAAAIVESSGASPSAGITVLNTRVLVLGF